MAKPKQKMDIKLHPEARRIIEGAITLGVKQVELAEYAGVEPNIISKTLGEERRLMASEFIDIAQGLGYQIERPRPAVLPSVGTIATILEVVLSAEKAGQVPKGIIYLTPDNSSGSYLLMQRAIPPQPRGGCYAG